ncbi:MAG: Ig-like domain-containing protein, partial [Candidatus Omnitrophica bacterium]|nr:Ig-like domain-containing protein [Candidatus Omnitrophota bacterium]
NSITVDSGGTIKDSSGNDANLTPPSHISATSAIVVDTTAPQISTITTQDNDSDGNVDRAIIVFDEDVDDSTLVVGGFTIGGVTVTGMDTGTPDDATITLTLTDGIEATGTAAADVLYTAATGLLEDIAGNTLANVTSGDETEIDDADPIMLSAVRNSDTQVTVTLSELLNASTITKAHDGGFTVTETSGAPTYTVSAVNPGGTNAQAVLTVADMDVSAIPGVTITYSASGNGTVEDLDGAPNLLATDAVGLVIPGWNRYYTLNTPPNITAGTEAAYTLTRYDVLSSPITAGNETIYLYSTGLGTYEFRASSGGEAITSIDITDGTSSVDFYYYDEMVSAGVTITASDNNTAPDGNVGADDTTDSISVIPDATSYYTLDSPADITAGTEAIYTVTRYDQFSNLSTIGAETVYLYSDGAGTYEFRASSGGAGITSIMIVDGNSSVDFYYYDEYAPASVTVTVSDNNSAPDGTAGFDDATDSIAVIVAAIDADVSMVSAVPLTVPADNVSNSTVTVTLYDEFSNPVSGKAVSLSSSRGGVDVLNISGSTDASGVITGTISSTVVGTATVTAVGDPSGENITITQTVDVAFSEVEIRIYDVQIDPIYDAANDAILITTTLVENGAIVDDLVNMTLTYVGIMNNAGTSLSGNLNGTDTVIDTVNAIYHTTWNPAAGLTADTVYTIIARITYNGQIYSGVKAFSVDELGALRDDVRGIGDAIGLIQTTVTTMDGKMDTVEDKIDAHEDSQAAFRSTTVGTLSLLTGEVGAILEDTSTTLSDLIATQVTSELAKGVQSEIVTRSTTVETGSTIAIRFRTVTGLAPTLTVYDPSNVTRIFNAAMAEVGTTGIYSKDVTFNAAWGLGDFTVLIQEPVNASIDSVMITVVQSLATGGTADSSSITTDLIYSRLTNMDSDITTLVNGMTEVTTVTTDVSTDIGQLIEDLNLARAGGGMSARQIGSIVESVGSVIGQGGDDEIGTILAKLAGIEGQLGDIGIDAAKAASLTQGSMGQSALIQSIVEHIKGLLEDGDLEEAEDELANLADKLLELKEGVDGVPGAVTMDSMSAAMQASIEEINQLAAEKGIEGLIPLMDLPEEGLTAKPEDVIEIRNGVSELKSLMVEVRSLLDQEINKPIVHGWFEGE